MRKLYYLLVSVLFFSATAAIASEITLFDRDGSPVAYIDTSDNYTIYLWDGTPSAYLADSSATNSLTIYGFNGKLLCSCRKNLVSLVYRCSRSILC